MTIKVVRVVSWDAPGDVTPSALPDVLRVSPRTDRDEDEFIDEDLVALTRRQEEVASLVTRGLTNPEIARALGVAVGTAKKHVRDLFSRLGVASRAELAARLVRLGIPAELSIDGGPASTRVRALRALRS